MISRDNNCECHSISPARLALSTSYVVPDHELETLIATIFAEVFGLDHVDADDDFFELGGDSLLAEAFSTLVSERTGYDFQLSSLLEYGSPTRIATLLRAKADEAALPACGEPSQPPIFLVHGRLGFTLPKPAFLQALAKGQKLRMFELPGLRGGRCYERVEDIAALYVAQLVEEYPEGPILLAAFCAGGLIALEMAAQLAEMRRPVYHLVLLDPPVLPFGVEPGGDGSRRLTSAIPKDWLRAKLLGLRPIRALYGLRFRKILLRRKREGRLRYSELGLSINAQAKFGVAVFRYRPRPYHGPVTILSCADRHAAFEGAFHISKLLPQRRVYLLTEDHVNIVGAATARLMQREFDAAFARAQL
jgi:thioesterase domain-containing protein/acyl carrier protein